MFNSLTGTVTHKGLYVVLLENSGIEWEITASSKTIEALPAAGNQARILTYLHHREDIISLYGFSGESERELFFELIRVSGIGPKQAVKILSGISSEDFVSAINSENLTLLSALPGIGQKTAQKIVLSMRGRLLKDSNQIPSQYNDIIKALSDMGFDYRKAAKVVAEISEDREITNLSREEREKIIMKKSIIALS